MPTSNTIDRRRIGLLGGSFNPPHQGHREISLAALERLGLDAVWWLVTPGNPLKDPDSYADYEDRLRLARAVSHHEDIVVSDFERRKGLTYTADTLNALKALNPNVDFVWLMGADNLTHFHRWKDWREILDTVPVGVLARPGDRISARLSPAARIYGQYRLKSTESHLLARANAPAWCFLNVPMVEASSTEIRARGDWSAA